MVLLFRIAKPFLSFRYNGMESALFFLSVFDIAIRFICSLLLGPFSPAKKADLVEIITLELKLSMVVTMNGLSGCLSAEDFRASCHAFLEKWNTYMRNNPAEDLAPCEWKNGSRFPRGFETMDPAGGYLAIENVWRRHTRAKTHSRHAYQKLSSATACRERRIDDENKEGISDDDDDDNDNDDGEDGDDWLSEDIDEATLVLPQTKHHTGASEGRDEMLVWHFHVVYNETYACPMLMITTCHSDGRQFALEEIEELLDWGDENASSQSEIAFLTPQEHPYLHRSWVALHPCQTSTVMSLLLQANRKKRCACELCSISTHESAHNVDTPRRQMEIQKCTHSPQDGCDWSNNIDTERAFDCVPICVKCKNLRFSDNVGVEEYMVAWLSMVGQLVNIKVPPSLIASRDC